MMGLNNKDIHDAVAELAKQGFAATHNDVCPCNVCVSKKTDDVNSPKHYAAKIQPIDAIEEWDIGFHLGNVVKYVARAGKKDPSKELEDLKKARWYLDRYIETLENK